MPIKNGIFRNTLQDTVGNAWDQNGVADRLQKSQLHIKDSEGEILVTFTIDEETLDMADTGKIRVNNLPKSATAKAAGLADHAELIINANESIFRFGDVLVYTSNAPVKINKKWISKGEVVALSRFTFHIPITQLP